jgi:prepilin-type N-terminal cleavage/methylation domain-containing protein
MPGSSRVFLISWIKWYNKIKSEFFRNKIVREKFKQIFTLKTNKNHKGLVSTLFFASNSGGVANGVFNRKQINCGSKDATRGFTIIELLVSAGIFAILAVGILGIFTILSKTVKVAREKTVVSALATDYLEIVRNMSYSQVGTMSGNPNGQLPDYANAYTQKIGPYTYKIFYEITYIDDSSDGTILSGTDFAPNDYKQVKMDILNTNLNQTTSFVTNVVPKGLEGTLDAGALYIQVIDANGSPVQGANIHITYPTTTPSIILDRQSDSTGHWIEVGLSEGVNAYRIVVTKSGYSSDQTYPATVQNPNPIKPDATILEGQVTRITFSIDLLANLNIKTLGPLCQNLSGVNVNVAGAKLIGTNPEVLKFNHNYSSVSGLIPLSNIEWDTYTPTLLTGQSYVIYGTSPIQKINVLPGTTQTFTMILGSNTTANSLLVIIKDAASKAALENAYVRLHKGGSQPQDYYGYTGGSVWVQKSWKGGSGHVAWNPSSPTFYYIDDGNIDINSNPTGVRLKKTSGKYASSGWLESSTFDTGTDQTNYTIFTWLPTSQASSTTLKFQLAANNDNSTWNYVGPDGTSSTYFTTSGTDIGSTLDNKQYFRYKVFLSTTDRSVTPVLTSLTLNFVTGCHAPGQLAFMDLTAGQNYSLNVSLAGYSTVNIDPLEVNGNQKIEILMSP